MLPDCPKVCATDVAVQRKVLHKEMISKNKIVSIILGVISSLMSCFQLAGNYDATLICINCLLHRGIDRLIIRIAVINFCRGSVLIFRVQTSGVRCKARRCVCRRHKFQSLTKCKWFIFRATIPRELKFSPVRRTIATGMH